METQSAFPTLSLCMIVKNEAQNLERCLRSVQGVVDEMVIVDTGSTDTTREIARAFGARVYEHAWQGDFAQARNVGLDQATGQWILHLDADEELEAESRGRIRDVLGKAAVDCFYLVVRNFLPPGLAAEYDDCLLARLFRNRPDVRYEFAVHEQIVSGLRRSGGKLGMTDLQIWHYGYVKPTVQANANRDQRNIELLEQTVARDPANAYLCAKLGLQYHQTDHHALAQSYLRRALALRDETLSVFMVQDILGALAHMAFVNHEYETAIHHSTVSLALLDRGIRALSAQSLLADIYLHLGRQDLDAVATAATADLVDPARYRSVGEHCNQARHYLNLLAAQPELSANGRTNAEARLAQCEAALRLVAPPKARASNPTAAETLQYLLEADDLGAALEAQAGALDDDLRVLVQANAQTARSQGEVELAEGLDLLAAYLDDHLAAAGQRAVGEA